MTNQMKLPPAEGCFAATLTMGPKGQIVVPKGARDLVGFKPGDQVLLLADAARGIAILPTAALGAVMAAITSPPQKEES